MASPHAGTSSRRVVPISTLVRSGVVAVVATNVANVLVLYLALAIATVPDAFVGGTFGPLAVGPVVANSSIAAIGGTIGYGIIDRYTSRPNRNFVVLAAVILVLSFGMFLSPDIADAPLRVFVVLGGMHVIAAGVIVGVLWHGSEGS